MNFRHKLPLLALAVVSLGITGAAQAETLYYDALTASSFSSTVTISGNPAKSFVMTGKYDLYDASNPASWNSFIAYCFEPLQGIDSNMMAGGAYDPWGPGVSFVSSTTLTVGGSPINATARTDIQKLFDLYYADSLTSSVKSAGFQLALWEIQNENKAANGYFLATGDVTLSNVANNDDLGGPSEAAAVSAAASYLTLSGSVAGHYVLTQWANATSQDFISADQYAPIPEPVSLALVVLGLAGVAVTRGRKLH